MAAKEHILITWTYGSITTYDYDIYIYSSLTTRDFKIKQVEKYIKSLDIECLQLHQLNNKCMFVGVKNNKLFQAIYEW